MNICTVMRAVAAAALKTKSVYCSQYEPYPSAAIDHSNTLGEKDIVLSTAAPTTAVLGASTKRIDRTPHMSDSASTTGTMFSQSSQWNASTNKTHTSTGSRESLLSGLEVISINLPSNEKQNTEINCYGTFQNSKSPCEYQKSGGRSRSLAGCSEYKRSYNKDIFKSFERQNKIEKLNDSAPCLRCISSAKSPNRYSTINSFTHLKNNDSKQKSLSEEIKNRRHVTSQNFKSKNHSKTYNSTNSTMEELNVNSLKLTRQIGTSQLPRRNQINTDMRGSSTADAKRFSRYTLTQ
eukprot:GHVL01001881.1.p2 GENE.GHVL01001881.1~~GHVL01001881.1.p2  ORF type:complete len:293 (+),score=29.67 GHVL01001881.1:1030-1908(+)